MGADKAFLELAGKPLIARAVELAQEAVPDVTIVGDPRKFAAYGTVIEDVYCDRGPLGGIHAALTNSLAEWNLILAVDLPFIPARFLKYPLHIRKRPAESASLRAEDGSWRHSSPQDLLRTGQQRRTPERNRRDIESS